MWRMRECVRVVANFNHNDDFDVGKYAESVAPPTYEILVRFKSMRENRRGRIRKGYMARNEDGVARVWGGW